MTETQFLEKWLPIELANCPAFLLEQLGKPEVEARLSKTIIENWSYHSDPSKSQGAFDYCGVEGATRSDYAYRCLSSEFGELVTSIRFVGGDLTKPAVFIMHKDFELTEVDQIKRLGTFLKEEYRLFEPKRIRWFSREESEMIDEYDFIQGDLNYYVEFVKRLRALPKPINYGKVKLVACESLSWYEQYKTGYEELYSAKPFFREMASVESEETLQQILEAGLLFEIWIGGVWAGIIGVCREDHWLFAGYVIYEEFLLAPFRGKRYAAAVQRQLVQRLQATREDMLYGTIHYLNQPSIKTASRVGRKSTGGYLFAEI